MGATALAAAAGMLLFGALFAALLGPLGRRWGTLAAARNLAAAGLAILAAPLLLRPPWEAVPALLPRAPLLLETLVLIGLSMGAASLLERRLGKTEYRILFHALAGSIVLWLLSRDPGVATGAIGLTFSLYLIAEKVRQAPDPNPLTDFVRRVIDRAVRPSEAGWYTPTPYFLGGCLAVLVLWPAQALPAIAVLSYGDPMAALVGSRWGRHKLPHNREKSIEGTAALLAASMVLLWVLGNDPLPALAVAAAAAAAESLPGRTDNLLIPIAAGAAGGTLK